MMSFEADTVLKIDKLLQELALQEVTITILNSKVIQHQLEIEELKKESLLARYDASTRPIVR